MKHSGLTPLFTGDDIERWFDHFQEKAESKLFVLLSAAGEKFVEIARKKGSYKDQTGNLRSSIGYIIAKDGDIVSQNFAVSEKGTEKAKGLSKGKQIAEEVSLSFTGGYVLVGVAGMNYAAAVEARGLDVVTSANIQCEEYLREALKKVFERI